MKNHNNKSINFFQDTPFVGQPIKIQMIILDELTHTLKTGWAS